MKTAQEVYGHYDIMPALQLHQLRVAAVAKLVAEALETKVNTNHIVLACLFHDMGNIIKMDLKKFPEFRADKGEEVWKKIQASFIEKYGRNAHAGNVAIAKEIGLPEETVALIDGISFSNLDKIVASNSWEQKICEYADTRVGPYGVLSLKERLAEARSRYIESGKSYYTEEGFSRLSEFAVELEGQIFSNAKLAPSDIDDKAIAPLLDELRKFPIA